MDADAELIFDSEAFLAALPQSIEAVFRIKPSERQRRECDSAKYFFEGDKCNGYAEAARNNMLRHFGMRADELPLVEFDPFHPTAPFRDLLVGAEGR